MGPCGTLISGRLFTVVEIEAGETVSSPCLELTPSNTPLTHMIGPLTLGQCAMGVGFLKAYGSVLAQNPALIEPTVENIPRDGCLGQSTPPGTGKRSRRC